MQIEALKDRIQGSKRVPVKVQTLEVEFFDSSYNRLASHYKAFERTWMNEHLSPTFTVDEFSSYIETLFALRCNLMTESPKQYSKVLKQVKIPALLYLVMESLGEVEVKDYGLTLIPKWGGKGKMMSVDDVKEISLKLQELEDYGHEMARGLPSSNEGSMDFMMMQVIDDVVRTAVPSSHPVYALLRSFVKMASFQDLVIPRIHFLEQDEYDFQYKSISGSKS